MSDWYLEVDSNNPDDSHLIGRPGTVLKGAPCPSCAAEPSHYEVRIDDQLVGTCQGIDEHGRPIAYKPVSDPDSPV